MTRAELVDRIGGWLDAGYYPRFGLLVIVSTAGIAGFLVSAFLLERGWLGMPSRYAIACGAAYVLFLLLVRLWSRYYRQLHPADALDLADGLQLSIEAVHRAGLDPAPFSGGAQFSGGGAGRSLTDALPHASSAPVEAESAGSIAKSVGAVADLDEGALWLAPLILAGALVVGLITAILVIAGAPALLGEVLLDAGIAGVIYRRLHQYPTRHWLDGVLRRTWKPMLAIALILVLAAAVAQHLIPTADSIGDFFRQD